MGKGSERDKTTSLGVPRTSQVNSQYFCSGVNGRLKQTLKRTVYWTEKMNTCYFQAE